MTVSSNLLAGRYRLGSVLGQGGMSVVYAAEDTILGRPVAVKILREQFGSEAEFLERFRREARAAARLSHPNIIAIYDVGRDGDVNYIVMELAEGEDLKAWVRREAPFSPGQIVEIGSQIASALDYAHRAGIVHRDIKSQNVLVTRDGQIKVADFGIAVALGDRSITQTGMIIGSVQYMAPEQAQGKPTSPATDIYSLGVVLYEMATGRLPFTAEAPLAVARMHIDTPPVPPQRLNPRLPPTIGETILATLAKRPETRPQSAALVAAALRGQRALAADPTAVATAATNPRAHTDATRQLRTDRTAVHSPRTADRRAATRPRRAGGRRGLGLMGFLVLVGLLGAIGALAGWVLSSPPNLTRPRPTPAPVIVATSTPPPANPVAKPAAPTAPPATATAPPKPTAPPPTPTVVPPTATPRPPTATPVPPVEVPGVVAQSEDQARRQLEQRGLKVEIRDDRDATAPNGTVIGQDPAPGSSIQRGGTVTLRVSRPRGNGPATKPKPAPAGGVLVPYVEGFDEEEARTTLEEQGFGVEVRRVQRRDGQGVVVDQNPGAGDTVQPGVTVRIALGE